MPANKDDKVVKEIIKRYGHTLDLKRSPYVIVEIIRQYSGRVAGLGAADCQPPGGPPPKKFDLGEIIRELNVRLTDVARLSSLLDATMNTPAKRATAKRATAKRAPAKRANAKQAVARKAASR